jgi:ABC-type transporter Mla subunit MlaD
MAEVARMLQAQSDAMATLPDTLTELSKVLQTLTETVAMSRETVEAARQVVARVDSVVDELETPVRELRASVERVNQVLSHPVVERVPATLEAVENTVLPFAQASARARAGVARVTALARRLVPGD